MEHPLLERMGILIRSVPLRSLMLELTVYELVTRREVLQVPVERYEF